MTVATWQDVATALGRPASDFTQVQQDQITYWLNGIELLIWRRLGDLAALDQEVLKYVETEAVAAKVPPTGAGSQESSITVAVDDANVTRRWEQRSPATTDDITDEWWALLSPRRESGSFSTRPRFAADCASPAPRPDWRPW